MQAALAALCQHGQQYPRAAAYLLSESRVHTDFAAQLLAALPVTSAKAAEQWMHVLLVMADGQQMQVRIKRIKIKMHCDSAVCQARSPGLTSLLNVFSRLTCACSLSDLTLVLASGGPADLANVCLQLADLGRAVKQKRTQAAMIIRACFTELSAALMQMTSDHEGRARALAYAVQILHGELD